MVVDQLGHPGSIYRFACQPARPLNRACFLSGFSVAQGHRRSHRGVANQAIPHRYHCHTPARTAGHLRQLTTRRPPAQRLTISPAADGSLANAHTLRKGNELSIARLYMTTASHHHDAPPTRTGVHSLPCSFSRLHSGLNPRLCNRNSGFSPPL